MTALFIYGTLQRGCKNHAPLVGQEYLGDARARPGCRLYDLGDFPGLVRDAADAAGVPGELWRIDDATLAALDFFEGLAEGLYARGPVELEPPFDRLAVQAYWYARSIAGRPAISGRWLEGHP